MSGGDAVEVRLLGPLELRHGDRTIDLGDRQQQHVLVVLLLHANRAISTERILDIAWARRPGADLVRHHVSRIRAAFRAAGVPADVASVARVPAVTGYRLSIDPLCIDAERFRALRGEAESAGLAGDERRELDLLHEAVALWRGRYLEGIDIDRVGGPDVVSPYEAYLDVVGDLAELELRRGRHRWVRDLVRPVLARDPTRQRLAALLMRALLANGDNAPAVRVFDEARDALGDGGVPVSTELRWLHAKATRPEPGNPLPEAVDLVGRVDELDELRLLILEAAGHGRPARIWISGPPGVGKTALAVVTAHRLRERCPDHQIVVDLNGFSPHVAPMSRFDALGSLLERLGMPKEQIPSTSDGRVRAYRSALADTKSVVLLDNAVSDDQVRGLLPDGQGCVGLVTSRRGPGAEPVAAVRLAPLAAGAAAALFTTYLHGMADRVSGREAAVAEIMARCGHMPLLIRLVASQFRLHRSWPLDHLAALLRADPWQAGSPLGAAGDAAIAVSYHQLSAAQRTLFRMLSSVPGPDLGSAAAAALGHCSVRTARALLEELHAVSLVEEDVAERYRMLDPIKEFGAALPPEEPETGQAMDRLLDFYLVTTAAAMRAAFPFDRDRQPVVTRTSDVALRFPDEAAATDWLSVERWNLSALIRYAVDHGRTEHVWQLAVLLWRWHHVRDHVVDWTESLEHARAVLDVPGGDRSGLALVLHRLSGARWRVGRSDEALELAARALAIWRNLADPGGEAAALTSIALVNLRSGNHDSAIAHFEAALDYYRRADDTRGRAHALSNLGHLYDTRGDRQLAERSLTEAVESFTELGHIVGLAHTLENRGCVRQLTGDLDGAVEDHERARELAIRMGDVALEARAVNSVGRAHRRAGRLVDAVEMHDRARELAKQVSDVDLRVQLHIDRGATLMAAGDPVGARDAYLAAVDFPSGDRTNRARAARGAALALHAAGDCAGAAEHWRAALAIFDELGLPDAADVRAELAGFDCGCTNDSGTAAE
jgi:tetratricopeptide (TPR) repeat protein/DNA-binding SARP family transcriptional activator